MEIHMEIHKPQNKVFIGGHWVICFAGKRCLTLYLNVPNPDGGKGGGGESIHTPKKKKRKANP